MQPHWFNEISMFREFLATSRRGRTIFVILFISTSRRVDISVLFYTTSHANNIIRRCYYKRAKRTFQHRYNTVLHNFCPSDRTFRDILPGNRVQTPVYNVTHSRAFYRGCIAGRRSAILVRARPAFNLSQSAKIETGATRVDARAGALRTRVEERTRANARSHNRQL